METKNARIWISKKSAYSHEYLVGEYTTKDKALENAEAIKKALELAGFKDIEVIVEQTVC